RRFRTEEPSVGGEPLSVGDRLVVDDVVDPGPAAFDRADRRSRRVVDVNPRHETRAVADDRKASTPYLICDVTVRGIPRPGPIEPSVAKNNALDRRCLRYSSLEFEQRRDGRVKVSWRIGPRTRALVFHRLPLGRVEEGD